MSKFSQRSESSTLPFVMPFLCRIFVILKALLQNTQITQPAPGYTFLSVGYADLADHCKELSRQRGADVRIVSVG